MFCFFLSQKLNELEKEEELRTEAGYYDFKWPKMSETMKEISALAKQIRDKKIIMKHESRIDSTSKPKLPRNSAAKARDRSVAKLKDQMENLGVDMEGTEDVNMFTISATVLNTALILGF